LNEKIRPENRNGISKLWDITKSRIEEHLFQNIKADNITQDNIDFMYAVFSIDTSYFPGIRFMHNYYLSNESIVKGMLKVLILKKDGDSYYWNSNALKAFVGYDNNVSLPSYIDDYINKYDDLKDVLLALKKLPIHEPESHFELHEKNAFIDFWNKM